GYAIYAKYKGARQMIIYVKCIGGKAFIYITVQLHLDSNFGGFRSSPSSWRCNRTWRRSELTRRAWGHDGGRRSSTVGCWAGRSSRSWRWATAKLGGGRWFWHRKERGDG
ncbi:uncharacterized protein A4U43_C04F32100, partial [Asparagus officinalis]